MRKFLASAAAIALAATMAQADPGKGKGNAGGGDHAAAQMKGGGPAKADRGPQAKGNDRRVAQADRGPAMKANRGQAEKADRGPAAKADRGPAARAQKAERRADRDQFDRKVNKVERRGNDRVIVDRRDDDRIRRVVRDDRIDFDRNRGLIDGCPPGLAKKNNGCMPPGLLRNRDDDFEFRRAFYRPDWWGVDSIGSRVYYDDGYLYRLGRDNSVLGFVPLLGGALSVGNVWPSFYEPMPVPDYYADYYNLGAPGSYRYADNVLYRIDPETAAITSIAALLTGDDITIGQPMPSGYDVYNVPFAYRDRYYDRPDARYRYADGYVYQVDPETQLVAAVIQLLT